MVESSPTYKRTKDKLRSFSQNNDNTVVGSVISFT